MEVTDLFHGFIICADDFGIKYNSLDYANRLFNAIQKYLKLSIDWEGQNYFGLNFDRNYAKKYVDISMPGYIPTKLQKLQQKLPELAQDPPHTRKKYVYDKHTQLATQKSSAPKINSTDTNCVQSINGTILFYAHALDPTMLHDLKNISN